MTAPIIITPIIITTIIITPIIALQLQQNVDKTCDHTFSTAALSATPVAVHPIILWGVKVQLAGHFDVLLLLHRILICMLFLRGDNSVKDDIS